METFDADAPRQVGPQRGVLPRFVISERATPDLVDARAALHSWLHDAATHARIALLEGAALHDAVERARRDVSYACATARARGLRVEHVIVQLEEEWRALPEPRGLARNEDERALARLVTLCILAYYASQ